LHVNLKRTGRSGKEERSEGKSTEKSGGAGGLRALAATVFGGARVPLKRGAFGG